MCQPISLDAMISRATSGTPCIIHVPNGAPAEDPAVSLVRALVLSLAGIATMPERPWTPAEKDALLDASISLRALPIWLAEGDAPRPDPDLPDALRLRARVSPGGQWSLEPATL